jgi:hypothetical protein
LDRLYWGYFGFSRGCLRNGLGDALFVAVVLGLRLESLVAGHDAEAFPTAGEAVAAFALVAAVAAMVFVGF